MQSQDSQSDWSGIQITNCKTIFFLFYQTGYYQHTYHSTAITNRILAISISSILTLPAQSPPLLPLTCFFFKALIWNFCFQQRWKHGEWIYTLDCNNQKKKKKKTHKTHLSILNNSFKALSIRQWRRVIPEIWEVRNVSPTSATERKFPRHITNTVHPGTSQWMTWVEEIMLTVQKTQGR